METASEEQIGIFGGSFDPIHIGHLIIASDAIEQMRLDRVVFVPAAQAPLKLNEPAASAEDRIEMTRQAIESNPRFELSTFEIDRGGTSYSIDTATAVATAHPDARLYWIIGGDQARLLGKWHRILELADLVEFISVERGEAFRPPEDLLPNVKIHPLATRRIDISSTEIREQIKNGAPSKYFLPEPVFLYIKSRNLYEDRENTS